MHGQYLHPGPKSMWDALIKVDGASNGPLRNTVDTALPPQIQTIGCAYMCFLLDTVTNSKPTPFPILTLQEYHQQYFNKSRAGRWGW